MEWIKKYRSEAGIYYYNPAMDKLIYLDYEDIERDISVKQARQKMRDRWPKRWKEIKSLLKSEPLDQPLDPYPKKLIEDVGDIYWITKADLLRMQGIQEAKANSILLSIARSKEQPLYKVLFGIGIQYVGAGTSKLLCQHFSTVDEIGFAFRGDLYGIPSIGPVVADSLIYFFRQERNW